MNNQIKTLRQNQDQPMLPVQLENFLVVVEEIIPRKKEGDLTEKAVSETAFFVSYSAACKYSAEFSCFVFRVGFG